MDASSPKAVPSPSAVGKSAVVAQQDNVATETPKSVQQDNMAEATSERVHYSKLTVVSTETAQRKNIKVEEASGACTEMPWRKKMKMEGVPDMSITGELGGSIVTVLVGIERCLFQLHQQLLAPMSPKLVIKPGEQVDLPDEDPAAFNLLVNWLFNRPLPRVDDLRRDTLSSDPLSFPSPNPNEPASSTISSPMKSLFSTPEASLFTSVVLEERSHLSSQDSFQHICMLPNWESFSPEELRLAYSAWSQPSTNPTARGDESILPAKRSRETSPDGPTSTSIPGRTVPDAAAESENRQVTLLRLLIMADKYEWEKLYNDTMDAFRSGEKSLERRHASLDHLELVFTRCPQTSFIQEFLIQYAFYTGVKYGEMSQYKPVIAKFPHFATAIMAKLDDQSQQYGFPREVDGHVSFRLEGDVLDSPSVTYHVHDGARKVECHREPQQQRT
ncbi:Uu.00g142670.m01.CDS01 [Anthostomella pinea]|uniref:Uu.00g142670.m01.CDS01 n=1 Tax=Anthostomella pinea TaxID=933095 RepID=A0AAI8YJ72_9PEZI|nr:Uu.00g142670.m01.CDS01 [Anthostomella pinea]